MKACRWTTNTKTTTKAEVNSGTSPSSVYYCIPDGGYPILNRVIDNPYRGITAGHLRQAFGLIERRKRQHLHDKLKRGKQLWQFSSKRSKTETR